MSRESGPRGPAPTQTFNRGAGSASFTVGYGLPGKPDYSYERPFDYFNFELALDSTNAVESVFSRGLLYGTDYAIGPNYRGVWGVYGLYDYVAPQHFPGIEHRRSVWHDRAMVAFTRRGAAGYGAGRGWLCGGGVIHGSGVTAAGPMGEGQRNYHYGVAPEGVLAAPADLRRSRRPRYHRPRLLHQPSGRHGKHGQRNRSTDSTLP